MAQITPEIREQYPHHFDVVPAAVMAAIDQAEYLDRLDEAKALLAKANASGSPTLFAGYNTMARKLLKAAPRDQTETLVNGWLAKAEAAATDQYRETCHAEAKRIRSQNPPAYRRTRTVQQPARTIRPSVPLSAEEGREPVTRTWLNETVKTEITRVREGSMLYKAETAEARELRLDAEASEQFDRAARTFTTRPGA